MVHGPGWPQRCPRAVQDRSDIDTIGSGSAAASIRAGRAGSATLQEDEQQMNAHDDTRAAAEAELGSLTNEFFRAVSFQSGESPAYERLHDLFIDGGTLIKNSAEIPEISTVEQFIAPRRDMVESGTLSYFHEAELAAITELFGSVAHRFSTYEKRGMTDGAPFEARGMISTQFIRTPAGWKISSMVWDDESPGHAIPDRYR
jgi:hypothetical protein